MTQEDKELLLKDLCGRLPYGVKFGIGLGKLGKYDLIEINAKKGKVLFGHGLYTDLETCRPYLRPMSSMTEEEKKSFRRWQLNLKNNTYDWLNAHHFDYRGLIELSLGIDCTGLNIY